MYKFPSLNSLRFFEAAGRHLSFTRAAEELNVTQAAVSHQIKALEQKLGAPLFRRAKRKLHLTDEGRFLLPALRDSFERIDAATDLLVRGLSSGVLSVMLRPFFASRWLSTRLYRFWQRYPDIDLRLHHTAESTELTLEHNDVNVRWGTGGWPDVEYDLLLEAHMTPVCSPKLLTDGPALNSPADVLHHVMLHDGEYDMWAHWLEIAGVEVTSPLSGQFIDDANVRMESVIEGRGIALAPVPLVADDLATGRVIAPFDIELAHRAYYVVYAPGALEQPRVRAFRDWLLEEAGRS